MTKTQHPMQHLAVRLLIGLMALSLLSIAGMVVTILAERSVPASEPMAVQTMQLHQLTAVNSAQTEPQTAKMPRKQAHFPQTSSAPKHHFEKIGETPSVRMPSEGPLQLNLTPNSLELKLNTQALSQSQQLRVLTRLMLLPQAPTVDALLAQRGVPLLKPPYYYQRILDPQGRPIRYPYQATQYAKQLLARAVQEGAWRRVRIPLKPAWQAHKAKPWSAQLSRAGLSNEQALLLAIMEVESGFNPKARSRTGAIGLMQLKPEHAVQDVAENLGTQFPESALYDAQTNLTIGAHYVRLLQNKYLAQVRNAQSREYLTIAAYNGGINAVLKQFGRTHGQAIARINQLAPNTIYRILRYQFPRGETRRYLEKVVQAKTRYQQWIKDNVI